MHELLLNGGNWERKQTLGDSVKNDR
jgi:hypothetical protein